jgi:hypothetical protein
MKKAVRDFLKNLESDSQHEDSFTLIRLMEEESGYQAALHGTMIGFGMYHYKYASGREGDWFVTGFAPRKRNMTVYIMPGFSDYGKDLAKLGKHKTAKSCLYFKQLADLDERVLRKIVRHSVKSMQKKYSCRAA